MIECLKYQYNIDAIGFIKVTSRVYKIKTNGGFYCLKYIENRNVEVAYQHIKSLHLSNLITLYSNRDGDVVTTFKDRLFIIMPWIETEGTLIKEMRLKHYFMTLAKIHKQSFYRIQVSKDFFDKQIHEIENVILERKQYYDEVMLNFENVKYRSPMGWMFVLHYYKIEESLNKAHQYLQEYKELVYDISSLRVSLVYDNFNYQHIFMKDDCLIAIDRMHIDVCIYDIFSMYQKSPDFLFDLDSLVPYYLEHIQLLPSEIKLLSCLLCIVPYIMVEHNEITNIVKMARLLYYIDSIDQLNAQLIL